MKRICLIFGVFLLNACGGAGQSSSDGILPGQIESPTPTVSPVPSSTPGSSPSPSASPTPTMTPTPVPTPMPTPTPSTAPAPSASVPAVADFELDAASSSGLVKIRSLPNGSVIDLSSLPSDSINISAVSADQSKTGSVHFILSGPITLDRIENNPLYTMATEPHNLVIANNELPVGAYTLRANVFELPDGQGVAGPNRTINFTVTDNMQTQATVPAVLGASLGVLNEDTGEYIVDHNLRNGEVIDLSKYPNDLLNFLAISQNKSLTGSVRAVLSGGTAIDHVDNDFEFTTAAADADFSVANGDLQPGDYTLTFTPYELDNAAGATGTAYTVTFSVIQGTTAPPPTPTPTLSASDDSYIVQQDTEYSSGTIRGVGNNDSYDSSAAVFSVTSDVSNGDLMMDLDGTFTYMPNSGFTGSDQFTYQIAQNGQMTSANATLRVVSGGGSDGFTGIVPSSDSRIIYVSSSQGKDTNNCLSEAAPCKTINAGLEKMRNGYPDHVLLKRGDVWNGENLDNAANGRSASEPAVISYYGDSGDRPLIENNSDIYHQDNHLVTHLWFVGLHFYAYKLDTDNSAFTGSNADKANIRFIGKFDDLLLEDNIFDHIEVTVQDYNGDAPKNFVFRRNIWTGIYTTTSCCSRTDRPSNLFAKAVDGLVFEDNVFDYGGWNPKVQGASADMLDHNLYIQTGTNGNRFEFRNNIVVRASSHGIQMRGGGLAEDNFFARNTIGLLIGYKKIPLPDGMRAWIRNNVISEGTSMVKGLGACTADNVCSSASWGMEIRVNGNADYEIHDNIIELRDPTDTLWPTVYSSLNLQSVSRTADSPYSMSLLNETGTITYKFENDQEGTDQGYKDPGRTLADYNASLGGARDFDEFMNIVKSRPLHTWDDRYSAKSINAYIREGFSK